MAIVPKIASMAWRQVPWPLWVFAAAQLLVVARVEAMVHGPILAMILYPVLVLGWLYFLLRGVRWIWLVTLGVVVLGLAFELVSGSLRWWATTIGVAEALLLLLPFTRRYFSKDRSRTYVEFTAPSPLKRIHKTVEQSVRRWAPGSFIQPDRPIINGFLVFYLGLTLAVLVFVVGGLTQWHEGAGHGSLPVDVLWHAVSVVSRLLELLFVVLLAIWAYRHFRDRKRHGTR